MLRLESVSFSYGQKPILRDLSFSVAPGEVVAICGVSGKGKTTLGRIISGHLRPDSGKVFLNDKEITGRPSRSVFLVSQESDLFPWQTVRQHLDFVARLGVRGNGPTVSPEQALRMVRLENEEKKFPRALSGGMQKRLALARALVLDPAVFVLDETFSPLDGALRQDIWKDLSPFWRARGSSVLLVSHDQKMLVDWDCRMLAV